MIHKSRLSSLLLALVLLSTSCVHQKDLLKLEPTQVTPLEDFTLNGFFINQCDSSSHTLWGVLSELANQDNDSIQVSPDAMVHLSIANNLLRASAVDIHSQEHVIQLKGHFVENHFSINRKLFLVPIPFIYYRHSERKVLVALNKDDDLVLKYGYDELAWILIAAGGYDGAEAFTFHSGTDDG